MSPVRAQGRRRAVEGGRDLAAEHQPQCWSRRETLLFALASGMALAAGRGEPSEGARAAARRWLRALGWPVSAAAVGRACLGLRPQPRSIEQALEALRIDLGLGESLSTPESLRLAVAARIRFDFESEDVVRVRGWILSRTEVRISALASLAWT